MIKGSTERLAAADLIAAQVADIAAVPAVRRESFCEEAYPLIVNPSLGWPLTFTPERRKRLEKVERANLELLHALRALPYDEQGYFQNLFWPYSCKEVDLEDAVASRTGRLADTPPQRSWR